MRNEYVYFCSAVVHNSYTEHKIHAVSEKQAWYKFCMIYGFRIRDFKIIGTTKVNYNLNAEQLSFDL